MPSVCKQCSSTNATSVRNDAITKLQNARSEAAQRRCKEMILAEVPPRKCDCKPESLLKRPALNQNNGERRHFDEIMKSTIFEPRFEDERLIDQSKPSIDDVTKKRPFWLCGHLGERWWLDNACTVKEAMYPGYKCKCKKLWKLNPSLSLAKSHIFLDLNRWNWLNCGLQL
ncbi:uncharacterized protein LOC142340053 isoform X1 [Convolutriloba macropyga]|uniref:uncharacterized protein LOC142340053 isoform X1 n=1 Tax=Convolutriloba macropyga TaxID=536237 RepID=UPI003F52604F